MPYRRPASKPERPGANRSGIGPARSSTPHLDNPLRSTKKRKGNPDFEKRKQIKEILDRILKGFAVNMGGATSIDITELNPITGRIAASAVSHPGAIEPFRCSLGADEPSAGLHPAYTEALVSAFHIFKASGNSLFVVEHEIDVIRNADWIGMLARQRVK